MSRATCLFVLSGLLVACAAKDPGGGGPSDGETSSGGGSAAGGSSTAGGSSSSGGSSDIVVGEPQTGGTSGSGNEDCDTAVEVIFRDFNSDHPDFEAAYKGQDDVGCGMVMAELDLSGGKRQPVFQSGVGTGQRQVMDGVVTCITPWPYGPPPVEIASAMTFADWYKDVPGVNMTIEMTLPLTLSAQGTYVYDSATSESGRFFPLDGLGFNELIDSQGHPHNFHFTTEAHLRFGYQSGQTFTFSGDDDLWIFVNGRLALDLGGLHGPISATLDFDAQREALGISPGNTYNMDIFHAERHTDESNFRIETNISCFETVPVVR